MPGRRGALAAGALFFLAVCSFVASFVVRPAPGAVVASGRQGPVSAAPGRARALTLPHWLGGAPRTGTMAVDFALVDARPRPGQRVLRAGTAASGIQVRVERDLGAATYLALRVTPWPGHPLEAALVPRLVAGHRYAVRIAVSDLQTVTAWVNGAEVVSYRAAQPVVATVFRPLLAGQWEAAGRPRGRALGVAVSNVTLSYRVRALPGSATAATALLTVAGMAGLGVVFVLVAELAAGGADEGSRRLARRFRALVPLLARRAGLVGILLVVAGGVVVELVTPPADAVGRRSGVEHLTVRSVAPGETVRELHVGAPVAQASAASVDATLRADLRLTRLPRREGTPLVTTWVHGTGISVNAGPHGSLVGAIRTFAVQGGGFLLRRHVPLRRWLRVEVRVVRSRKVQAFVDGVEVFAFTYASPVWGPAPSGIQAGAQAGVAVRDVSATTVLYAAPPTGSTLLLVRLGQALGFLLVAGGAALLAARLLRRLVPAARPGRRLVRVVFGIAAAGIAVNLLVDALRLQRPPAPFAPRNTWLFAADARFADFLQTFALLKSRRPYGPTAGSYPPVGYFLVAPFAPMHAFAALLCFLALFAGVFGWWLWRSFGGGRPIEALLVVVVAFASYPVSFAVDRANVDLLVALLLVVAVAAVEQRRDGLAAGLIGLAAAAKIFPGLYALVFIRPLRRWRYALAAALTATVATLLCFLGFAGSLAANIAGLRRGLHLVELLYANGVQSTLASITVSSWVQSIAYAIGGVTAAQATEAVTSRLVAPEEILGALVLGWYLWRRERSTWRTVTLVTVAVLVLPQVSYAYELVYLFVPLALFVRDAAPGRADLRIAALFGLLLAPKTYLYFGNSFIGSSTLFNAPLLVALAVAVVLEGRAERRAHLVSQPADLGAPSPALLGGAAPPGPPILGPAVAGDRRPWPARHGGLRPRRSR